MSLLDLLRHDLLTNLDSDIESGEIFCAIEESRRASVLAEINRLVGLSPENRSLHFQDGKVVLTSSDCTDEFNDTLTQVVRRLIPWRKGPLSLFGQEIDAEWRSDLKYDRLGLSDITGMDVADVGCGNGYYMFRMLELNPASVVGFDPTERYLAQYLAIRSLLPQSINSLAFVPRRSDALLQLPARFDLILCLGVLYHHPEPDKLLSELNFSLRSGGTLVLETIYSESKSFLPGKRYARMKNVYLIPSMEDLFRLLEVGGFREIEKLHAGELSTEEQRRTPFSPGDSLIDFLAPDNPQLTIEGYARPHRVIIRARKR